MVDFGAVVVRLEAEIAPGQRVSVPGLEPFLSDTSGGRGIREWADRMAGQQPLGVEFTLALISLGREFAQSHSRFVDCTCGRRKRQKVAA